MRPRGRWAAGTLAAESATTPGWPADGTTEALTLYNEADWGSGQVHAYLRAFQTDGMIRYYTGTYTVQNGVIVAAHIVQN